MIYKYNEQTSDYIEVGCGKTLKSLRAFLAERGYSILSTRKVGRTYELNTTGGVYTVIP